jgi:hypothetical protein
MQCEAGAYYDERAHLRYVCERRAVVEVVCGATTLIVYCQAHAREMCPAWMLRSGVKLRPLRVYGT